MRNLDSFAAEYFRIGRAESREERKWVEALGLASPWSQLEDLTWTDPEEAWKLILALIERAPHERDLSFVAAGPLEDLIGRHGRSFAGRIANEAATNVKLGDALNFVWGWNQLADEVWAMLAPILDPRVRAYWSAERAADASAGRPSDSPPGKRRSKDRWRPPQPRPKSDRLT